MTALLASEFRRMLSRRLFLMITGLAVLGIVIAGIVVTARSHITISADQRFHLTALTTTFEGLSPVLIIASWLLGASFIGADWHAGTVATLLTWEPRRLRVMLAKLIACVVLSFAMAIALQALLGGVLTLAAMVRGTTEGAHAAWIRETVGVGLRVGALASVGAAIGFALASVARNTAAALGVGFGYTVIVENLVRGLRPQWAKWLMGDNAALFILGPGPGTPFQRTILQAGLILGIYSTALLAASLVVFRARDVQ